MQADTDPNIQPYIWNEEESYWDPDLFRICNPIARTDVQ